VTTFGRLVRPVPAQGLLTLSDQLIAYQPHHHALFLDQTVSDALGGEAWAVRRQAAFEAAHALLTSLSIELDLTSADEKLDLAGELFAALGHGKLTFEISAEGGVVHGDNLHHGTSFGEKYGGSIRNKKPMDAFAAGYCAATATLTFPSDWGLFEAEEVSCVARRDDRCSFVLTRRPERVPFGAVVTRAAVETMVLRAGAQDPDELPAPPTPNRLSTAPTLYPEQGEAARIELGVTKILSNLDSDDRGRVRAFGVNLALVPSSYSNQITFDTMHLVEKRTPELFGVYSALAREASQSGAFHLLGGVLASSKWIADFGLPAREIELRLQQLIGIARALGWGALQVVDFAPRRQLVLKSSMTPESAYYTIRHGSTVRSRLVALQGLALALVQLLHRVDFRAERPIVRDTYDGLFKSGARLHVEETRSPLRGDASCEVVVDVLAER
jgi:hypothetical protein